jgi:hypothetical protein
MPDIVLNWKGATYRIPEDRAFEAGAAVEEIVTLAELESYNSNPRFFKIARAMGCLLRFAGCKVSDREIKAEIDACVLRATRGGVTEAEAKEYFVARAFAQLHAVLFDGAPDGGDGDPPGETSAS